MLAIVAVAALVSRACQRRLPVLLGGAVLLAGGVVSLSYALLPKIEVRLVHRPASMAWENLHTLYFSLDTGGATTLSEVRDELREMLKAPYPSWRTGQNLLLGGTIQEQDSPGNFTLRQQNGRIEFVIYGPDGGEEIAGHWTLKAAASGGPQPASFSARH